MTAVTEHGIVLLLALYMALSGSSISENTVATVTGIQVCPKLTPTFPPVA